MPDIYLTAAIEAVLAIPGVEIVVHFSGGKDSDSTLHAVHRRYGATHRIRVAFADTGNEYRDDPAGRWISAARWCIQRAASYGYGLTIVHNPKQTLPEEVLARGRFPSPSQRWCTAHMKRGPLEKFIRSLPAEHIISVKGIRADESDSRAHQAPWEPHLNLTVRRSRITGRPRYVWNWLPIHHWRLDEVLGYVAEHNIPLHPIYQFQERFSCEWCIFYSPKHIVALHDNNRRAFDECAALEQKINFTLSPTRKFLPVIVAEYKAAGKRWTPPTKPYARSYACDY
jgi:3'-phosphoadenosine 5'-phosphosulfate sulfotransferase (PAPS reductase)/FAD synthetase